jgi:hypothetical protein
MKYEKLFVYEGSLQEFAIYDRIFKDAGFVLYIPASLKQDAGSVRGFIRDNALCKEGPDERMAVLEELIQDSRLKIGETIRKYALKSTD